MDIISLASASTVGNPDVRTACETYTDFVHERLGYQGTYLTCYDGDSWNPYVAHGILIIWSSGEGSKEANQEKRAIVSYSQSNRVNNIERYQMHLVHDPNFIGDPKFLHFPAAHKVRYSDTTRMGDMY
jgi:hypothetical protein